MCTSECRNKLRHKVIDALYVGVKLLNKHDRTTHRFLTKRFPSSSPNDMGERSVEEIQQNDLAFWMNAMGLEVLKEVCLGLLIMELNMRGYWRNRRRRWLGTLKRVPSWNGFVLFGCHDVVYPKEREKEQKETHVQSRKEKNVCMKNAWIGDMRI